MGQIISAIKKFILFKKYYFKMWKTGRRCVPSNSDPIDKTIYIKNRIKKFSKKYPNSEITLIVPSGIYYSIYQDLVYEGYLNNIMDKNNIELIKRKENLILFSNHIPHCDILLKRKNLHKYYIFGLY